jgi:hypothetical protein
VAGGAVSDIRVKGGRLPLKQRSVGRVACDAFCAVNTFDGRVARRAVGFERSVRCRQFARHYLALPAA